MQETSLYAPVKRFLESLDFTVKGEIGGCDIVGLRDGEPPVVVICELKLQFNLELVLQGVDRAAACDEVWLAARMSARGKGREHDRRFRALCRRLGFGLLAVDGKGKVELLLSPAAVPPRRDPRRRSRLVEEHHRRKGDPSIGGSTRKKPIMTAYRQEAIACAAAMADGPKRPRDLKPLSPRAASILLHNYYGWFARTERGIYALTEIGHTAVQSHRVLEGPLQVAPYKADQLGV
ncbi:DUF2161 domain-containing phosphodiesterase [Mesorhizobium captivum]|uniref:DUF2161 domain-containing phosphodiesterase n=1 Tax=Mesorhizobium captivum TaxID=3072319 RepID=UPI002A2487F7|nr:DUF2161 family putative PD-(D/E)XK-type phosphodiesterase [Mesorhizobium sp. VK23E]MDX8510687.1 DUF2161 family putative PD-(D/E)XK-type phosphodiesterase [Mesorhizobium sp. VK23E]